MGQFKTRSPKVDLSRPSINLTGNPREWRTVTVKELQRDDIVAGWGKVEMVLEACDYTIFVEAGESIYDFFEPDTEVFAFVLKGN